MHFRPSGPVETIDGRSTIELWDGTHHVATIYAQRAGLHIVCEPPYAPADIAIEPQQPSGLFVALRAD